ncbi:MAG: phage Gp37/Gp68 family protein [Armatimonadota bacterium]
MGTKIEWTQETINLAVGCTKCSPGCENCYAAKLAATRLQHHPDYKGLAESDYMGSEPIAEGYDWTGEVRMLEYNLEKITKMQKPRMIFLNSMGDLFHESVSIGFLVDVFRTILSAGRLHGHTFQILTKRPDRMAELVPIIMNQICGYEWQMPNYIWLGVTAENQEQADKRIPLLIQTPAAVRFVSVEPMLGGINLTRIQEGKAYLDVLNGRWRRNGKDGGSLIGKLDWVICGGETGQNARPMHPDWVRSLRDQCQDAGVPFFFKSWGEWHEIADDEKENPFSRNTAYLNVDGGCKFSKTLKCLHKIGKKRAGRVLDGHTWDEYPEVGR